MYQLLNAYLQQEHEIHADNMNTDNESGQETSTPEGEGVTIKSLVTAFQQFMESATVGQYEARSRMLLAFHCQMSMVQEPSGAEG